MRSAWAAVVLFYLLLQWQDIAYFYSNEGVLSPDLLPLITRTSMRFTLLTWISDPTAVFTLYLTLLLTLFCMLIGLWPRASTIASVLLLFSFHERNPMILGGGDTLLRDTGFLLMIAPGIGGFSIERWKLQWQVWHKKRSLLPPPRASIWPWRMLLWQMIILYSTSLWYKLLGTMWVDATAVAAVLHHPIFSRLPKDVADFVAPFSPFVTQLTLFWHAAWLLMLVPETLTKRLPIWIPRICLRRWLLLGGLLFHGSILLMMDAGCFSLSIFVAYLGLLREEDFLLLKNWMARPTQIVVLFDGHCGLCLRSTFTLRMLDWLGRLSLMDFRDPTVRRRIAPDVTLPTLDRAMHIKLPDGSYRTGFDAFRYLAWHLPPTWPLAPLLYLPGIPRLGRKMYATIALRRQKCNHKGCNL